MITADQMKAARSLVGWSDVKLVHEAGLDPSTIINFELGTRRSSVTSSAGDTFKYAGAGADLTLDDLGAQLFHGKIADFAKGDILDVGAPFGGLTTSDPTTLHFFENAGGTGGQLVLTHDGFRASLTLLGSYSQSHFHLASDGHGGSLITYV
jgi:hypothetical protein